jgi:ABC-type sugar transport system permease subunit
MWAPSIVNATASSAWPIRAAISVIVAIVFTRSSESRCVCVNAAPQGIGRPAVPWLRGSEWAARIAIAWVLHWGGIGSSVLLFLGEWRGSGPEPTDAAKVDGATDWNVFWRIPLSPRRPIISFLIIVATIGLTNLSNQVKMLTKGGPRGVMRTVMHRPYELGCIANRYGDAAAHDGLVGIPILTSAIVQTSQLRRFMN